jgi:hypothetical protein
MSSSYKNNSKKSSSFKRPDDVSFNLRPSLSDELKRELLKNEIFIEKWYHKLLMGNFMKSNGSFLSDDSTLKRLAAEYQKALHIRNIDAMVLIRNELFNHLPEQMWIHMYLTGQVLDQNGKPLNKLNQDIEQLSQEYIKVYERAKDVNI